ncbi:two-component sensor histidine kinase [Kineobactrum sediminis]|uniref:histidine kinase n=1 Tax=Kineobactrum sediminis TaxID=1905677 RepID=A0A2N5Y106_9GAMM|nr:ATP-binding protein [Kineobactrum sediminis]PLW82039.1 two-component sensor histidine kinase [Kineobactrum sediminis]
MRPRLNSLAARLLLASALLLPLFLGTTGAYLERSHRLSIEAAQAERLQLQLRALLAQAEFEDALELPQRLIEGRLAQVNSGIYAFVTDATGAPQWVSPSALQLDPAAVLAGIPPLASGGQDISRFQDLQRASLQVLWQTDRGAEVPLRFTVLETTAPIEAEVSQYRRRLLLWLGGSGLLLLGCQVAILVWGLRPLRELAADIGRIESGASTSLERVYPREVRDLTGNLNTLLKGEEQRRERVRNTMADLAHSLKTPLAVIRSANPDQADYPALVGEQTDRMEQIVAWQLQRTASGSHRLLQRVPVAPVAQRLRDSLAKVYSLQAPVIELQVESGCHFRGDERDLLEIMGNLMDNACKYGGNHVRIRAEGAGDLTITIEDNGPGVAPALRAAILERGFRADSRGGGHGLGLSVAADIAASYQGRLSIDSSELGGALIRVQFAQPG